MIISNEQVRLVLRYLHTAEYEGAAGRPCAAPVSSELLERISAEIQSAPEIRGERMEHARSALMTGGFASEDVAAKIIGRAISDWVR
jgi:hypothetical protein